MPQRTLEIDGTTWTVAPSGRWTQYLKDEFSVTFARADGGETRMARYSPLGAKARETSLAELSDAALISLFQRSQPSWTAAELGYRR